MKLIDIIKKGLLLSLIALAYYPNNAIAKENKSRPNILIAIADDATWFHWKQYQQESSTSVNTPTFDRIAGEGLLFTNCYTPNPKCAPSRAVLFTGRNTWQLEEASYHVSTFPKKFPLYPDLLEDAGYLVGYTGKGWGPGSWKKGGLKRNPAGDEYNEFKLASPPTKGIYKGDYVRNFEAFLGEKEDNQPFCFWYGCKEPHRPYEYGSGVASGKDLASATVLPFWPDNDTVRTDLLDYAYEIEWFDKQLDRMLKMLEDRGELDNTLIIVTADNGMSFPRCKGNVYDAGVHLPLAIMWADEVKGERTITDFVSFRDFAPTLLEAAGVPVPEQMTGESFLPVLKSKKSGRIDKNRNYCLLGREVYEIWNYPVRSIKMEEMMYIRNYESDVAGDGPLYDQFLAGYSKGWILQYPTDRAVLSAKTNGNSYFYDLDIGVRDAELLYDLSKDPYCLNNLIEDEEYSEIKKKMIETMEEGLLKDNDPRILGNGDIFKTYPYIGKLKRNW